MQEAEISPLQSLTRHFVSQLVSAVREVEGDMRGLILLTQLSVGSGRANTSANPEVELNCV